MAAATDSPEPVDPLVFGLGPYRRASMFQVGDIMWPDAWQVPYDMRRAIPPKVNVQAALNRGRLPTVGPDQPRSLLVDLQRTTTGAHNDQASSNTGR